MSKNPEGKQGCCKCTAACRFKVFVAVGLVLSVLGAFAAAYWPKIFDAFMFSEIAIKPSSRSYPIWKDVPLPVFMDFSFYNWTNPHEIFDPYKKPTFQELGPYVFSEQREKIVQAWHDNDTVTFYQNRTWKFEPDLSNGTLDDLVTTLNVVAITATYALRNTLDIFKIVLNLLMNFIGTQVHVTKTVEEFLFKGYEDPLLTIANALPVGLIPVNIPFDKFGWVYTRNGSPEYDGRFNMYTGVEDITRLAAAAEWNYQRYSDHYESDCGRIYGSAGEMFPPHRTKTNISLLSTDFCRTFTLTYKEEVKVDGIPGLRFCGDSKMFGNPTTNPDNWCFCDEGRGECLPDGLLNVTTCKWGAPAFISYPHFLHTDPAILAAVEGISPPEEQHELTVDIEPITGFPLEVAVQFQINLLVQPMPDYKLLRDMPRIFFPTMWMKQRLLLDDELGPQLKLFVLLEQAGSIIGFVFISIGVTILLVLSVLALRRIKND